MVSSKVLTLRRYSVCETKKEVSGNTKPLELGYTTRDMSRQSIVGHFCQLKRKRPGTKTGVLTLFRLGGGGAFDATPT